MKVKSGVAVLVAVLFVSLAVMGCSSLISAPSQKRFLVFSKTLGFRHKSIENGLTMFDELATKEHWGMDATEDARQFTTENLNKYSAVVFLNTSGDVFDAAQMDALKNFIHSGKGFLGIHAATDTEKEDDWYPRLVGARFANHPPVQLARLNVLQDTGHPAIAHLGKVWERTDEWYNFLEPVSDKVTVLIDIDESSYEGPRMGSYHPVAWVHELEGGRVFYTVSGHLPESYNEDNFIIHVREGLRWVMAKNSR